MLVSCKSQPAICLPFETIAEDAIEPTFSGARLHLHFLGRCCNLIKSGQFFCRGMSGEIPNADFPKMRLIPDSEIGVWMQGAAPSALIFMLRTCDE